MAHARNDFLTAVVLQESGQKQSISQEERYGASFLRCESKGGSR